METTEYDLYDLLIGDDDISGIGDGSVTGALTSLDTSITNLTGFSLVYDEYDHRIMVYTNGILAYFLMQGTFFVSSSGTSSTGSIPSQYAPIVQTTIRTHPTGSDCISLGYDGSITYYANSGTGTSRIVRIAYCYPLRASLP